MDIPKITQSHIKKLVELFTPLGKSENLFSWKMEKEGVNFKVSCFLELENDTHFTQSKYIKGNYMYLHLESKDKFENIDFRPTQTKDLLTTLYQWWESVKYQKAHEVVNTESEAQEVCNTCKMEMDSMSHNYGTEDILTCIHCCNDAQM